MVLQETERFLFSHEEQATEFYSVIPGIGDEVPNKQSCKHVHVCPACRFWFCDFWVDLYGVNASDRLLAQEMLSSGINSSSVTGNDHFDWLAKKGKQQEEQIPADHLDRTLHIQQKV